MTGSIGAMYIVNNVGSAIEFYTKILGFEVVRHPRARVRDSLKGRLQALPYETEREGMRWSGDVGRFGVGPGGWNRISIEVENI